MYHSFNKTLFIYILSIILLIICLPISNLEAIERRIKVGDVLDIIVYEHPELSRRVTVNAPHGKINYPFMQHVAVVGLTTDDLSKLITYKIADFTGESSSVMIFFADQYDIYVRILGLVNRPGEYLIPSRATIQGAITIAGGVTIDAQLNNILLYRKNQTEPIEINLEQFLQTGDQSLLPQLEHNDTIIIISKPGEEVQVLGAVHKPGKFYSIKKRNILDVILMAGGTTNKANLKAIKLSSGKAGNYNQVKINLEEYIKTGTTDLIPLVQPGDVIFVPEKKFTWEGFSNVMVAIGYSLGTLISVLVLIDRL